MQDELLVSNNVSVRLETEKEIHILVGVISVFAHQNPVYATTNHLPACKLSRTKLKGYDVTKFTFPIN